MRKLLYLFLAFAMITSAAVMPAAAAEENTEAAEAAADNKGAEVIGADAAEYLTALGADWLDGADLTAPIARKDFAKLICLIGGYTPAEGGSGMFLDVEPPEDSSAEDYSGYIHTLANVGIVSKGGNWFEPDRSITKQEAAAMLVRVLGYQYLAEEKGGFPTGYMLAAGNLNLFDNTGNTDESVSIGAAAQLCANALDTDMMRQIKYGDDGEYKKEEGYTLAFDVFGIVHQKGVVEAVDLSALKGKNTTNPYYMTIDGISVYVNDIETIDYLGFSVDAFYKYDKGAARNSLIWIKKSADNYITEAAIDDVKSIGGGTFEYYDENYKTKSKSYSTLSPVIYNGTATGAAFDKSLIKDKQGKIRLLDNDGDNTVDVIFVDAYTDFVVSASSANNKRVYDAYDNKKYIDVDTTANYPYTVIYDKEGKEITIADIASGSILSVFDYQSDADQGYMKIYVSNDTVSGTIEKIVKKDGAQRITVNGTEYKLTDDCEKNCESKITAGSSVILRLDYYGYAADIKSGDGLSFGYLIATKLEKSLDDWYRFRIYNADGELAELTAADRIGLDNNTYDNGDIKVLNSLIKSSHIIYPTGDASCTAQPIRYRLNAKGELSYIDSIYTKDGVRATADTIESDDALYAGESDNYRYREGGYIFGGKFIAKNSTVFLGCPVPGGKVDYMDAENYDYVKLNSFSGGTYYTARPYYITDNALAADYVVYDNSGSSTIAETVYISVVKQIEKYWEDGTNYTKLVVVGRNGEASILCKEDFTFARGTAASEEAKKLPTTLKATDLKAGDVIRYNVNQKGHATAMVLYYRIADNMKVTTVSDAFNSSFSLMMGYPLRKYSDGFSLYKTLSKDDMAAVTDSMCDIIPNYSNCSYVIYDSKWKDDKEKVSAGGYDDIMGYKDTVLDCTKLIIQTDIGTPRVIVIVK